MSNREDSSISTDVLIIGAGPVGLFAAFQSHLCGLNCIIVDSLSKSGGQCTEFYPDKPIFDIPAIPKCIASELIDRLKKQLSPFNTPIFLQTTVTSVKKFQASKFEINKNRELTKCTEQNPLLNKSSKRWESQTNKHYKILSDYIILATGAGRAEPQKLSTPGNEALSGKYIHYSVQEITQFDGKRILIVGGGDSALDWALTLCHRTNLTLIHRRKKFTAQPNKVNSIKNAIEKKYLNFYVSTLRNFTCNDLGQLINVELSNNIKLMVDHILVFFGLVLTPCPIIFENYQIEMSSHLFLVNPSSFETSVQNIFACGDAVTYPNKQKLILSGFHEASLAIRTIMNRKESKINQIEHSSSNKRLLEIYDQELS